MEYLSNIVLSNNELKQFKVDILASDPTGGDLVEGRMWYNSTSKRIKYRTDTATLTIVDLSDAYITADSVDTLTNKSIDGDDNTISDLLLSMFKAGEILTSISSNTGKGATDGAIIDYVASQITELESGLAWKDSATAATTGNISLSGEQTIDDVSCTTGDRVVVKDQTTSHENGVYDVSSGSWSRSADMNASADFNGAVIQILDGGTSNGGATFRCETINPIIGTDSISFAAFGSSIPDATTTTKGKVELATSAEAEAKSSSTHALTPSSVANFPVKKTFTIGDGSSTSFICTHGLGTRDVMVQVSRATSPYNVIQCDIDMTDTNNVTVEGNPAPDSNELTVVIIG